MTPVSLPLCANYVMIIQLLVNGLVTGCAYALIAMGFGLIYNTTRTFHFAHGAVYTLSVYLFYTLSYSLSWSFPIALTLAIGAIALFGIIIDELIYSPLAKRKSSLLVQLLSSIGLYTVLINLIALIYGNEGTALTSELQPTYAAGPIVITKIQIVTILVFVLIFTTITLALKWTRLGKMVRAMRDDPDLISAMGVKPQTVRRLVFSIGSSLAGVAAILTGLDVGIDPHIGIPAFLNAAVAVIIGGVGNFKGAALGALVLGILQSLVIFQTSTRWQETVTFTLLILFLLFRPEGILSRRRRIEEAAV